MSIWIVIILYLIEVFPFSFLCWCFLFPSFMPCVVLSISWKLNQQNIHRWLDESVNWPGQYERRVFFVWCDKWSHWFQKCRCFGTSSLPPLYVTVACCWLPPHMVSLSRVQSLLYLTSLTSACFLCHRTKEVFKPRLHGELGEEVAAAMEKVFVALPAEYKAGQSTLSWVLSHFGSIGATVVITHVHVPPQMIPVSTCLLILCFFLLLICWRSLQILVPWLWACGHENLRSPATMIMMCCGLIPAVCSLLFQ